MKYTIDHIRDYLTGWILNPDTDHNEALHMVLENLEDKEDGIKAMVKRQREMHVSEAELIRLVSGRFLVEELPLNLCRKGRSIREVDEYIAEFVSQDYEEHSPDYIRELIHADVFSLKCFIERHGGNIHEA